MADFVIFLSTLVGTRDLQTLRNPLVSLNLVYVLVFFRNFYLFYFLFFMCFLFSLLFCIIKIKCFFFTFTFLFIWMQVWSLEKEDTPHSFSSKVFLHYYKFFFLIFYSLFGFFFFVIFFLLKLFYCIFAAAAPSSLEPPVQANRHAQHKSYRERERERVESITVRIKREFRSSSIGEKLPLWILSLDIPKHSFVL